jgi:hypothetical protein
VALEEAQGVELVVGLPDPQLGLFELGALAFGVAGEDLERACLAGGEVVERLSDAVMLLSKLRRGQRACARVCGFVGGEGLGAAGAQLAGKAGDGVFGWLGRSVGALVIGGVGLGGQVEVGFVGARVATE